MIFDGFPVGENEGPEESVYGPDYASKMIISLDSGLIGCSLFPGVIVTELCDNYSGKVRGIFAVRVITNLRASMARGMDRTPTTKKLVQNSRRTWG